MDFNIIEDKEIYSFTDSLYTTYTIAIQKENQPDSTFSNLVVKYHHETLLETIILNYKPTQNYLNNYLIDRQTPFQGTIQYESINLSNINLSLNKGCTRVSHTYCNWSEGNVPGEVHTAGPNCTESFMWTEVTVICNPEPTPIATIDAGNSSGGGGTGIGDPNDINTSPVHIEPCDTSGGFTDNSGCGGLNDDDQNQQDDSDLDCSYLNSLLNDDFKLLIQNLNTNANLSLNYEKGFQLNFDTNDNLTALPIDGNPNSTSIQVNIDQSGNTIGFIHTHYNGLVPNFSIEDIRTFDAIFAERVENNKTLNELTMILISSSGVYAVLIDDYNKLLTEGGNLHTNEFNKKGGIKENYDAVFEYETNSEKIERLMIDNANTLNKFGLSLMKAKSDLSEWQKVTPDPNNSNKTKYEDCNSK